MTKTRDERLDGMKFLLIYLVVFGHMLYYFIGHEWGQEVYLFIYSFHMPAFLFLTGYFSRGAVRRKDRQRVFMYFALYFFIKCSQALVLYFDEGKRPSTHFFWDMSPAWYALAVGVYLLVLYFFEGTERKRLLLFSILLSLACGFDSHIGAHYASERILVFFPFFLMGYLIPKVWVRKTKGKWMKLIGGLLFGLWIFAILRMPNKLQRICIEAFKGRKSYGAAGLEGMWGPAFRLGAIVVAGLLVFSLLCLMPKKPVFARFGRNTLGVYALHPMFITLGFTVFSGHDILMNAFPKLWMPALMLIAFLTTWILSADPLEKGIEKFLGA